MDRRVRWLLAQMSGRWGQFLSWMAGGSFVQTVVICIVMAIYALLWFLCGLVDWRPEFILLGYLWLLVVAVALLLYLAWHPR